MGIAWGATVSRSTLTIDERAALLPGFTLAQLYAAGGWLCREIVATKAAEQRVRDWALAGAPTDLRESILHIGDCRAVVRAVVNRLPDPVCSFLATTSLLAIVGRTAAGLFSNYEFPDAPAHESRKLIVVSAARCRDEDVAATLTHENGHAFLGDPVPSRYYAQAVHRIGVPKTIDEPLLRRIEGAQLEAWLLDEARAARFARALGCRGKAADPDWCVEVTRRSRTGDVTWQ